MSDLEQDFTNAAGAVKGLASRPSDEALLNLYAHYKQATEGDVHGDRPGLFDFKGGAKYDAWETLRGLSQEDAMQAYIRLVEVLKAG